MIGERVALLAGLFLAPALLLWLGHRLRDRSVRARGAFWGGVAGHAGAVLLTVIMATSPPIWWAGGGFWRDFAVHWSLLLGTALGLAVGAAVGRQPR